MRSLTLHPPRIIGSRVLFSSTLKESDSKDDIGVEKNWHIQYGDCDLSGLDLEIFVFLQLVWELGEFDFSDDESRMKVETESEISSDSWRYIERLVVPWRSTGMRLDIKYTSPVTPAFYRDGVTGSAFTNKSIALVPPGIRADLVRALSEGLAGTSDSVDQVWLHCVDSESRVSSARAETRLYETDFSFGSLRETVCGRWSLAASVVGLLPLVMSENYTDIILCEEGSIDYKPPLTEQNLQATDLAVFLTGMQNFLNTALSYPVRISNFGESISSTSMFRVYDLLDAAKMRVIREDIEFYFAKNPKDCTFLVLSDLVTGYTYPSFDYSTALSSIGIDVNHPIFNPLTNKSLSTSALCELLSSQSVSIDILDAIVCSDLDLIEMDPAAVRSLRLIQIALSEADLDWVRCANTSIFTATSTLLSRLVGRIIGTVIGEREWPRYASVSGSLVYSIKSVEVPSPWPIGYARSPHSQ